jgi:molecular chaperone IbpA
MSAISHTFPKDIFFGFDSIFDALENPTRTTKQSQGYPPYNVIKKDDNNFLIEIAVAGFKREDISLILEKGELTIKGIQDRPDDNAYVHRGISSRQFERKFTLADTMVVLGADIADGLLLVGLENKIPEEDKPITINLGELSKSAKQLLLG